MMSHSFFCASSSVLFTNSHYIVSYSVYVIRCCICIHKLYFVLQTPKEKRKAAKDKNDDDEDYKPEKPAKIIEKPQQETPKRTSLDGKKVSSEKAPPKEDKRRDSTSKDVSEKKKEEKKKERKSVDTSKSEEGSTTPSAPSTEPIRANVKRTIQELLNQRVKQDSSIVISNEEVSIISP